MSTASEKANLARIRDNQRRSRARRKEYLQELEARVRQCELQGVEASAEIQTAARKVAEENKMLRSLLAQHGVRDESIDLYIQSTPVNDIAMGGVYGNNSGTVQMLEQLLQTRKSCCTAGTGPMMIADRRSSDGDSSGSLTTTSIAWDPTYSQNTSGRRRSRAIQQAATISSTQRFMTPSTSTASRTSTMSLDPHSSMPHHQRVAPGQMVRNSSPASNPNQHMYEYDQTFPLPTQPYSSLQGNTQKQPQFQSSQQRHPVYVPTASSPNVNNCNYAADMITTMAGVNDSAAVRADLGCLPGMDCEVDNQIVFDVMDRYSGVGL